MASMYSAANGRWQIDVFGFGRVYTGTKSRHDAETILWHVERLVTANELGNSPDGITAKWLKTIAPRIRKRLIAIGLIPDTTDRTLQDACESFKKTKSNLHSLHTRTIANLTDYFGGATSIDSIDSVGARAFKAWLATSGKREAEGEKPAQGLAQATVSRRIKCARSIFKLAVESKWIGANPFLDVRAGKQNNPSRLHFVPFEDAFKIMDQLPTAEFRLVFALGRFAGMRCPSEPQALKWSDIDWARRSMTFDVPKLAHLRGKERRTCPIFVQLQPYLTEAFEAAETGAVYTCPTLVRWGKRAGIKYSKRLRQAIDRAGLKPWPKLLDNLRKTRATEVSHEFGPKAESEWIGHGEEVALRHYLMVTDDQWELATGVKSELKAQNNTRHTRQN